VFWWEPSGNDREVRIADDRAELRRCRTRTRCEVSPVEDVLFALGVVRPDGLLTGERYRAGVGEGPQSRQAREHQALLGRLDAHLPPTSAFVALTADETPMHEEDARAA
jgi:hypothetical protein